MTLDITKVSSPRTITAFNIFKARVDSGRWGNYSFKDSVYISTHIRLDVICNKHGVFSISPNNLVHGSGCTKCNKRHKWTPKEYIEDLVSKGIAYTPIEDYIKARVPILHRCNTCAHTWKVSPDNIKRGKGCPKCANLSHSTSRRGVNLFSYTGWEEYGKTSNNFDSYKVYVIKCYSSTEVFYKIGKTFRTIDARFNPSSLMTNYTYSVIYSVVGTAEAISVLEYELHKSHKEYKYIPNNNFDGMYECFSNIKGIHETIKSIR